MKCLKLAEGLSIKVRNNIHIANSSAHYNELFKYFIPPLVLIILEYLNSEIAVWKYGFITKKFKVFDDVIVNGTLSSALPTIIYYKNIKAKIDNRINLNWIDNFKHIEKKDSNDIKSNEVAYMKIENISFPIINGIYKIIPISNVEISGKENVREETIIHSIKTPKYICFHIIYNIKGEYTLLRYFFNNSTLHSARGREIVKGIH